ncbi:hypothetical protein HMPREF1705_03728 [Acetomicrobium hydrogeniformans ATCC BAA-1850]|uniref:Uncharacterized protein n=1 Tax=Acetomicrobium hydrogeniformans ATCC BAA-1850 TaxID=592015 RepID=A0A0T5XDK3_9BACT|nr:hypothetical protein HMPREF1705_03728 [Acetomicrobium hydrogeniformans ATCC BAA-1850]
MQENIGKSVGDLVMGIAKWVLRKFYELWEIERLKLQKQAL